MLCLVYADITLDEKNFWEVVTVEQFSGHREHCTEHKLVKAGRRAFGGVERFSLQDKCGRLISTQINESLHAFKVHYANKLFRWGQAWTARCVSRVSRSTSPQPGRSSFTRVYNCQPCASRSNIAFKQSFRQKKCRTRCEESLNFVVEKMPAAKVKELPPLQHWKLEHNGAKESRKHPCEGGSPTPLGRPQVLRGIEGSLRRWMSTLLKSDLRTARKVFQWNNALEHYCGNHTHCLHW